MPSITLGKVHIISSSFRALAKRSEIPDKAGSPRVVRQQPFEDQMARHTTSDHLLCTIIILAII